MDVEWDIPILIAHLGLDLMSGFMAVVGAVLAAIGRIMSRFGVNFFSEVYFEVEAVDQEEAMDLASDLLYNSLVGEYEWDCNECLELDEV